MKIPSDALAGLMQWATRDTWREEFQEVLWEHFGETCEDAGIEDFDELVDIIGHHWFGVLMGCAFEDMMTRDYEHGNFVDDYLKRRGGKEKATSKAYMKAIRNSVMSLYEISDITIGESFLARDLIRGGEPVRVYEKSATQSLKQWDQAAMRVVDMQGQSVMTGGLLPFEPELTEAVLDEVRHFIDNAPMAVEEMLEELGTDTPDSEIEAIAFEFAMRSVAPICSDIWLEDCLLRALEPERPSLVNTDGDEIEFIQLVYRLKKGVTQKQIRAVLDDTQVFSADTAKIWSWLQPAEDTPPAMADGPIILGSLELKGRTLEVHVNSESRAERAKALLTPLLDQLVDPPLMARQQLEQAMAEHRETASETPKSSGIPPEEERRIIHEHLDNRYRAILDEPIPMLDDLSPRKAVRTKKGREKVVAWLKYLENQTARSGSETPLGSYDFGWMWRELGIEKLRH